MSPIARNLVISFLCAAAASMLIVTLVSRVGVAGATAQAHARAPATVHASDRAPPPAPDLPGDRNVRTFIDNLVTPTGHVNHRAVRALQAMGPDVVHHLLPRFTGRDGTEQEALLAVLKAFAVPEVAAHLVDVLGNEPSQHMAAMIGSTLHTQGDPQMCRRLIELLESGTDPMRLAAAAALRTSPPHLCAAALLRALEGERTPAVKLQILQTLAAAPLSFLEQGIEETLADEDEGLRLKAVQIIADKKLTSFAARLHPMVADDPSPRVRRQAAQALVTLREDR